MMRVNGLYGHIQRNNAKAALLIAAFVVLFMCMQAAIRALPILMHANIAGKMGRTIDPAAMEKEFDEILRTAPFGMGKFASSKDLAKTFGSELHSAKGAKGATDAKGQPAPAVSQPSFFTVVGHALAAQNFFDVQAKLLLAVAAMHLVIATWWNSLFIRYATRAKPLARKDFPELYDVVENLAIGVGLPCPAIEIVESPKLNAYASGLTPASARLGLTTGLIDKLTRGELEAVIAHELTHIRQGDSRLMAVLKACVDLVLPYTGKFSKSVRERPFSLALLAFMAFAFLGWKFLLLLGGIVGILTLATYAAKAMVLHAREFVADAGAIELTKNPAALISALCKIASDDDLPVHNAATQAMMFSGNASGLFSTHPSVEDRIAAIQLHGNVSAGDVSAERARGVRAVARPVVEGATPSFGRRRVHGLAGVDSDGRFAARNHALASEPQAVWREQAVFASRSDVSNKNAPTGNTLFERWIMTGRLKRGTDKIKSVATAPFRWLFALQFALCGFGLVMTLAMALVR